jgi:hypothetical protein
MVALVAAGLLLTLCGSPALGSPASAALAPIAARAEITNVATAVLTTVVVYSGTYDATVSYHYTVPSQVHSVVTHVQFSFRESVSLVTPESALKGPPTSTAPVSDSANNPITFQDSGALTNTETPDAAKGSCTAKLSGINGVGNWSTVGGQPPVEIAIAAMNSNGTRSRSYMINVSAIVPTTAANGRVLKTTITSGRSALEGNNCQAQGLLSNAQESPAIFNDPQYRGFVWPGPRESPFLVLPLDTKNYAKTYSVSRTEPFSATGVKGTVVVRATGSLAVNLTGVYVSVGDSFSTGNFPDMGVCGRSPEAFPELYANSSKKAVFLACSGATTDDVLGQVPQVPGNATIVSVTAGGDDLGLATLVGHCLLGRLVLIPCMDYNGPNTAEKLAATFASIQDNLVSLDKAIKKRANQARVFFLGYPNPLPASLTTFCSGLEVTPLVLSVARSDLPFFDNLQRNLNLEVAAAAARTGATYVPPITGHDVCSSEPWFFPLGHGLPLPRMLHPNADGQRAMESAFEAIAGPPPQ